MKPAALLMLLTLTLQPVLAQSEENLPHGTEPGTMLKGRLDHACIRVADIDLSIDFYRKAFGLEVKVRWDSQTIGDGDKDKTVHSKGAMIEDEAGGVIEIFHDTNTADRQEYQKPINHFAFRVKDVEAVYNQALEAGGKSIMSPIAILAAGFKVKTAFVFGPDGERIEIINYDQ